MVGKYRAEIERLEASEALHKKEARDLRVICDELQRGKNEETKQRDSAI